MFVELLKMTRPKNIVIAIITLVVGYALFGSIPDPYTYIEKNNIDHFVLFNPGWIILVLQALGFAFAIGFANIQNDILDLESDKMNRPERPLVTGKVSVKAARRAWIAMFVLMLLCGLGATILQNYGQLFEPRYIAITFQLWFFALLGALLIAYNKWLKHIPLLKNMTVAFLCTTPLLFVLLYFSCFPKSASVLWRMWAIIPAIPFAFLLTTAREIYKDLEDETGDLKAGIMTFPLIAGSATARRLAGAIIAFTWISLPLPVFYMDKVFGHSYPPLFLIITGIALTPTFAVILFSAHRKNYRRAQSLTKVAMFAGLIALIVSC
ncbi:geranylgeranylglycerol-phosphate geranylgeranyltransferase [uncultured Fibrobacter sp.]|uniref:geranylgeranylglycerol-phosphate geranylgeranyltransferase n=1 Tax=uncultured Fibrobacter sp. TaxID=261512 RepID=UPI0025DEE9F4|nr:geranylgeranylglycerol-phosphate geranylgeranyltransferase [uncultured Fibrobacter sp.]